MLFLFFIQTFQRSISNHNLLSNFCGFLIEMNHCHSFINCITGRVALMSRAGAAVCRALSQGSCSVTLSHEKCDPWFSCGKQENILISYVITSSEDFFQKPKIKQLTLKKYTVARGLCASVHMCMHVCADR